MSDPLSVAASVAGLVSLGLQTTEYLYRFYTTYRDRDADLARTADRLNDLLEILRNVHDVVSARQWRANERAILRTVETCLSRCEDVVYELRDEAQKFQREPVGNIVQQITAWGRRAAYPFRRSTLEKLDEDAGELHENLSRALGILQLREHQNTQEDVRELSALIRYAQASDLTRSIRDWLRAPDVTIDYNAAAAKSHAGTGQWFTHSKACNEWFQQENSFLWLYGFAGCGKSVLCTTTIQHVNHQRQPLADSAIAFFFFTFNDASKQDASALLRALLAQLGTQVTGVEADLVRLKRASDGGTPSIQTLLEYVRQAVVRSRHTYILLDALDECPEGSSRDTVLNTVNTMRKWSIPGFHLLVTSRDIVDIRTSLDLQAQNMVAMKSDGLENDIRQYVSHCVDHDPKLRRWQDDRQIIKDHLVEHANGVFRWVNCQLEPLRYCPKSRYDLERCLKRLPSTLDDTYERMLSAIDVDSQERARRILVLLCLAARELTVIEIIEAIAVDVSEQEHYDLARKLDGPDDLLRICPGLIVVLDSPAAFESPLFADGVSSNALQVVRIAHFSVQEYLFSERIRQGRAANFAISDATDHAQISKTCMIYLCREDFLGQKLTKQLVDQYAFAPFAAQYWFHHFRLADDGLVEGLQAWGLTLCRTETNITRLYNLYDVQTPRFSRARYDSIDDMDQPFPTSVIYYLALTGMHRILVEVLKSSKADVNTPEGIFGEALIAASSIGDEKTVQVLLDAGADANPQGRFPGNALQVASVRSKEGVVRILLGAGADVNTTGPDRDDSALQLASMRGNENIVQILIDAGANVNAQGISGGTALQAASAEGHDKVAQMLVNAGADINMQGGPFSSNLLAALLRGHEKVVHVLVGAGADVNTRGAYDGNALQAALVRGYDHLVQVLLDAGADVNIQGGYYGNALQAATVRSQDQTMQLLVDSGADVNARGGYYGTALQAASAEGQNKKVQILLDAGADVNARGGPYGTALQAASVHGHDQVVKSLLNAGADADARGGDHDTALQSASVNGHVQVVQMLLDAGADVNIPGGQFGNALENAIVYGRWRIVQMLEAAGAKSPGDAQS